MHSSYHCGRAIESRTHKVAKYELCKDERVASGGGMWRVNEGGMKSFDKLDSSEKTMATLGNRWAQTTKQEWAKICKMIFV